MAITIKFWLPQILDRFYIVRFNGEAVFNGKVARVIDYGEPYYYIDKIHLEKVYTPADSWTVVNHRPDGICLTRRFADYLDNDLMYSNKVSIAKNVFWGYLHGNILHKGQVEFENQDFISEMVPGSKVIVVSKQTPDAPDAEPVLGVNIRYAFYQPANISEEIRERLDYLSIGKLINIEGNNAVILFDL